MNYRETLNFLFEQLPMYQRVGAVAIKKDLGNIKRLCTALGDPQDRLKSIHIAGTNGKGSVAHMIASILTEAGYKTGIYSSPHYVDFRERVKIDGQWITETDIISFVERLKSLVNDIKPSFFEISVAMAFDYFAREKVDFAVVETGLGGRLDSTNILSPLLSIITNVSLDHQEFLGDNIADIAFEKAGIIKQNTPVLIGEHNDESKEVFLQVSKEKKAEITFLQSTYGYNKISSDFISTDLEVTSSKSQRKFKIPFAFEYQCKNFVTALACIDFLQPDISDSIIQSGILKIRENTKYIFRSSIQDSKPIIAWDSAHNDDGFKVLFETIDKINFQDLHIIFSSVKGKSFVGKFFPKEAKYYFCKSDIPRAKDPVEIKKEAKGLGFFGDSYETPEEAFQKALEQANDSDLIIICGSIFTIGELMRKGLI